MAEVIDRDRGFKRIRRFFEKNAGKGQAVRVGIQGTKADESREAGLTNVKLMSIHEFGATINHPGGTPYKIVDGRAIFLSKDNAGDAVGVTKPHTIVIPERAPMRKAFDANVAKYGRTMDKIAEQGLVDDDLSQELTLLGEEYRKDIINGIRAGLTPKLKKSTIRRRQEAPEQGSREGRSVPLWDTGQLVGSISSDIEK